MYDVLATYLDQLKGKTNEIDSYGITDDLKNNANAIVFSSNRLDIKELEALGKMLKPIMEKIEYKEAINGTCNNEIVRENITQREPLEPEKWMKLIEIARDNEIKLTIKEKVKKDLREYCYANNIEYPYEIEGDGQYKPAPATNLHLPADEESKENKNSQSKKKRKKSSSSEDDDNDEEIMKRLNNLKY